MAPLSASKMLSLATAVLATLPQTAEATSNRYVNFPGSAEIGWSRIEGKLCCFTHDRFETGVKDVCPGGYSGRFYGGYWGSPSRWAVWDLVENKYQRSRLPKGNEIKLELCSVNEKEVAYERLRDAEDVDCVVFTIILILLIFALLCLLFLCHYRKNRGDNSRQNLYANNAYDRMTQNGQSRATPATVERATSTGSAKSARNTEGHDSAHDSAVSAGNSPQLTPVSPAPVSNEDDADKNRRLRKGLGEKGSKTKETVDLNKVGSVDFGRETGVGGADDRGEFDKEEVVVAAQQQPVMPVRSVKEAMAAINGGALKKWDTKGGNVKKNHE